MRGSEAGPQREDAFGARLRELRKSRGLSLLEVAAAVGVSKPCVCQWESGKSKPRHAHLERLALALQTSTLYLLSGQQLHPMIEPDPVGSRTVADLILRARRDVARSMGVELQKVRIVIR